MAPRKGRKKHTGAEAVRERLGGDGNLLNCAKGLLRCLGIDRHRGAVASALDHAKNGGREERQGGLP